MAQNHSDTPHQDLRELNFTLWRLRRAYDSRHRQTINKAFNDRPRTRGESLN